MKIVKWLKRIFFAPTFLEFNDADWAMLTRKEPITPEYLKFIEDAFCWAGSGLGRRPSDYAKAKH